MSTDKLITPAELTAIRDEYEEIRGRNGADAIHNPDALAALKLVETLLREVDGWAESWEEDVAFIGGTSPADADFVIPQGVCDDTDDFVEQVPQAGVARREVRAYRWQILHEPSVEDDE